MNTSFASLIDTQIVDVELGVRLVEEVALLELELDLPARQLLVEGRPARRVSASSALVLSHAIFKRARATQDGGAAA